MEMVKLVTGLLSLLKIMKNKITVKNQEISIVQDNYISLTDIAKYKDSQEANDIIRNWLRNRNTIEFLGLWEQLNNKDFKPVEFDGFRKEAGLNSFTMSPTKWINSTNAVGIISKAGRYGGTYAHQDISKNKISFVYANEGDLLNIALFGKTAKQWKKENPEVEGNMRDYTSSEQLVVLANLENLNAQFIKENISEEERLIKLNQIAIEQINLLLKNKQTKIKKEL